MPSKSSGRIEKVRKNKHAGSRPKNHRWESFSTKIARLNSLQQLRRVRRHDLDDHESSPDASYFQAGIQKWSELNLSKSFCAFKTAVLPLSESLPQILHHEKQIVELLVQYISMHDKDALEPLLDLLTALAHDLGVRFERHYARSLGLLRDIVEKPQEVEVIEWTFSAMAFLFKYLSKLLIPDLRPTFNVLTPILGKTRQPQHIARFAAEAMSFLVRKAAAPSHRATALPTFIEHTRDDLKSATENRHFTMFKDGLMTMFSEAIKGPDMTIHSAGGVLISALIDAIPEDEYALNRDSHWVDLICGVLTSTIHHATADTIGDLVDHVIDGVAARRENLADEPVHWQTAPLIKILSVLAGVRKGSRIRTWDRLVRELVLLLSITGKSAQDVRQDQYDIVWRSIVSRTAIIWHQAPIDVLIPHITLLLQSLTGEPLLQWFIPFCAYFCNMDPARFGSLFRSTFQKFMATHWSEGQNQDLLCVVLPKMIEAAAFPPLGEKDCCRLSQAWQDQIVSKFERLEISPFPERGPYNKDPQAWRDRCLPQYAGLLHLLELTAVHPSTNARIAELLLRKLKLALHPSSFLASDEVHFIVSRGFRAYLLMGRAGGALDASLGPLLRAAVPRFARSVGFLQSYRNYQRTILEERNDPAKHGSLTGDDLTSGEDPAASSLLENLNSPSHEIRLTSLELLKYISDASLLGCLDDMLEIEQTPLHLDKARTIAMLLRKLGQQYALIDASSRLKIAIPRFLFGMLTVKLSPVWDSVMEVLQQVTQDKLGETIVASIAFEWLENVSTPRDPRPDNPGAIRPVYTNFECTALGALEKSADETLDAVENANDHLLRSFDEKQQLAEPVFAYARSRALKVLNAMPAMAEKRSRLLVPHLLSWLTDEEEVKSPAAEEAIADQKPQWSLPDRKAILSVFSQFINPRTAYQQDSLYQALLKLLANGDVELQKLALKAILAWKQEGVKAYQENLENLLDDSRFKNEISVFVRDDAVIKSEHRPELMPVLLRLLYGRTISKKGAASGRNGLQATRLAILRSLSVEDLGGFLDIAAGKLRDVRVAVPPGEMKKLFGGEPIISVRKQMGFLNMISSFISELGIGVEPYTDILLNAVLYCLIYSSRKLHESALDRDSGVEGDEDSGGESLLKVTRSQGIKCLTALFQNSQNFQWDPYHGVIAAEVMTPRLEKLPAETTQGVSGMLQLFSTLSVLPQSALLLAPRDSCLPKGVLPSVIACLGVEKTKDEVKIFVLGLVQNLVKLAVAPAEESVFNDIIMAELLRPNAEAVLANIMTVLGTPTISNELLEACVDTILILAPVLQDRNNAQAVIRISSFLLKQPPRRVSPKIKSRILLVVEQFVSVSDAEQDSALLDEIYDTLASLFSYFKDRQSRHSLCRALYAIARQKADLVEIANLCQELNSFKDGRIDEPDYDRRLTAFNAISAGRDVPSSARQWLPLLHNLIFFIRMDEDFGVLSSNSADGIRSFIKEVVECEPHEHRQEMEAQIKDILMPSIYSGAREQSASVRREYLRVFGFLLTTMSDWPPVADLAGLLSERQEDTSEPSFFFDILSPATSRQLEALRTLEAANSAKEMSSQNLSYFFIPLLEHFIYDRPEGSDDHGLGAQATSVIGSLAMSLQWTHWRSTFHRYCSYIGSRPETQKHTIRLLSRFSDALSECVDIPGSEPMEVDEHSLESSTMKRLRRTFPKAAQFAIDVVDYFLPPLTKHLHEKDESDVSYRVPVGVVVIKLLRLLPPEQMDQKLAGVLTDICHILRSKAWESREMARDTLVKIALILGPSYFGFILKELRGALTRGYQLHVLSYTMHSILVALVPKLSPGDLDDCLHAIVTVVMDDVFGVIGQEKDADGYTNQMKEIKSSKSQDSMELVAKNASISHLVTLVKPLQALLLQKVDLKMVRKIDTLMSRIGSGLLQNPAAESRDTLVFCYEIIQEAYRSQQPEAEQKLDARTRKYLVQKGAKKSGERGKTTRYTHKLVRFAFDILRSTLKKHDSLRTSANIAGFLPVLGDAIIDGEEEVKISALRMLATIVKVPFTTDDGDNIYKVAVKEAIKSVSMATSSTTDLAQAALRMLAVVLRERRDIPIKDAAIDLLLGKIKDDLTEPLYRHVTFNFLRSVLERRIETAAVYDTLDFVGTIMISNDDKDTRDLARGAFFQFIREYPQKRARWGKQLDFIVANLKYDREGGRLSVMEILHLLLNKSSDDFVQEISGTCFLPLFLVLANDESDKCRLAAAGLLKMIFQLSDRERTTKFLALLRSWLGKDDKPAIQRLALRVFGFYFEANEGSLKNTNDIKLVMGKCTTVLKSEPIAEVDEQLLEIVLGVVGHFTSVSSEQTLSADKEKMWADVAGCLRHPGPPVKLAAARLMNTYLVDFARHKGSSLRAETIWGSHGLSLSVDDVVRLSQLALGTLQRHEVDEVLADELVQILIFLASRLPVAEATADEVDDSDESEPESGAEEHDAANVNDDNQKTLEHFFWRLSGILRKEIPLKSTAMNRKVAAMTILETVCRRASVTEVQPSLRTVLRPLQHLTDPTIPIPFSHDESFKTKLEEVKTRARIMMDALQKRLGTTAYAKALLEVGEGVRARRQQRTSKRKIEAVAQPEKHGVEKRKRFERNKERRKMRASEHRSMRKSYNGW